MRGFVIGLVGTLALGTLTLAGSASSALAQPLLEGRECRPPVASPAGFQDCQIRVVAGQAVCRCRIAPGLDVTRRSPVNEAVSALPPAPRTSPAPAGSAAASLR